MHLKLGQNHAVVISSAKISREIMKTHDAIFASRPITASVDSMFYGGSDIAFSPNGEHWRRLRRLCNQELLSLQRVRSPRGVRQTEVSRLIRSIHDSSGRAVVNLSRKLAETTNNVMARAVIGGSSDEQVQKAFLVALANALKLATGFTMLDLFPSLPAFLTRAMGLRRKLEGCQQNLDQLVERIIREHKKR